jgi:hypothetical protein
MQSPRRYRSKHQFNLAIKKALRMRMGIAIPTQEIEIANNPFLVLGFGMNAYFKIIKAMLYMMFWVCIANIPLFYIFA